MVPLRAVFAAVKHAKNQRVCFERTWLRSLSSEPPRLPKAGTQNAAPSATSNKMEVSESGKGGPWESTSITTKNLNNTFENHRLYNEALIQDFKESVKIQTKHYENALQQLKDLNNEKTRTEILLTYLGKGRLTLLLSIGGSYFMMSFYVLVHEAMKIGS